MLGMLTGKYLYFVYRSKRLPLAKLENGVLRLIGVDKDKQMTWKEYLFSVLAFSAVSLVFLMALQMVQKYLPFNPEHQGNVSWHLAFNTASSFVTNTNWQSYSGEVTLSYLTQFLGLTVQNFVSAAVGIAVMFALIRGFSNTKKKELGNFWSDMVRINLYVLLPLSIIVLSH